MERIRVLKLTEEDWHPSYKLDDPPCSLLAVSFLELSNGRWCACVWGADDFGMEFDSTDRETAWDTFLEVIRMPYVSEEELKVLGFLNA